MNTSKLLKRIVSTEYLVAAILVALFYIVVGGFQWYWLLVAFVIIDASAVGYLKNEKLGALTYNIAHSLMGPSLVAAYYVFTSSESALFITLAWLFHILVDRALGYGLKHSEGFSHTHLGTIGKAKPNKK